MGIGDQHHPFAGGADGCQKGVGIRAQGDQVCHFALEFAHRKVQLTAPEVRAVPVELAGMLVEQRQQLVIGLLAADAVQLGVALGQMFEPEVVVEMQVEQGAVHVEQHGVDGGPGQRGHGQFSLGRWGESSHGQRGSSVSAL